MGQHDPDVRQTSGQINSAQLPEGDGLTMSSWLETVKEIPS